MEEQGLYITVRRNLKSEEINNEPIKTSGYLIKRYPELAYQRDNIIAAYNIMEKSYSNKGKLLIAGNGGSAADAEHIVGELMKGFENPRKLDKDYIKRMEAIDIEMGRVLGDNLLRWIASYCS